MVHDVVDIISNANANANANAKARSSASRVGIFTCYYGKVANEYVNVRWRVVFYIVCANGRILASMINGLLDVIQD